MWWLYCQLHFDTDLKSCDDWLVVVRRVPEDAPGEDLTQHSDGESWRWMDGSGWVPREERPVSRFVLNSLDGSIVSLHQCISQYLYDMWSACCQSLFVLHPADVTLVSVCLHRNSKTNNSNKGGVPLSMLMYLCDHRPISELCKFVSVLHFDCNWLCSWLVIQYELHGISLSLEKLMNLSSLHYIWLLPSSHCTGSCYEILVGDMMWCDMMC